VPADTTRIDSSVHFGSDSLIKQGPGTLVLSAANLHTGGTIVEEGTLVVRNLSALGQGGVQVRAGAKLVLDGGGGRFTVPSLTLDAAGRIDVGMSQLSIRSGFSRDALLAAIDAAKGDDGMWTGTSGIGSSVVQGMVAEGTNRTLGWLGWVDNGDASVTVGFAAPGDTNLDGSVDMIDLGNFIHHIDGDPAEAMTWNAGDFNHDDAVDLVDFAAFVGAGLFDEGNYLPAPPPATPENLRATPVSTTSITLSWNAADTPAGYEIERSADGITDWRPVTPSATQINGTSATIGDLEPGERAFFRLRAFNESPSWWWDDRYRSADTAAVAATAAPSKPSNVKARAFGATAAQVEWIPGWGRSTGFVLQRRQLGTSEWVDVGTLDSRSARGLLDKGVEPGQSYMYRVWAVSHTSSSVPAYASQPLSMPLYEPPVIDPPSDRDGDGVSDLDEIDRGLDPDSADTDGDGVDDGDEDKGGSDPSDPGSTAEGDPWKARVQFTSQFGSVGRTFGEEIKETKTITLPASVDLPTKLNVTWSVDDAVRVNGQMLGTGYAGAGAKTITTSVRTLTLELIDTVGGNWGGWVELAVPAVDLTVDELPAALENVGAGAIVWRNSDFSRQIPHPDLSKRDAEPGLPRCAPDYSDSRAIDPEYSSQFTPGRATLTPGLADGFDFQFLFDATEIALWTRQSWVGFDEVATAPGGWWRIPAGKSVRPGPGDNGERIDFWIEGLTATGYGQGKLEMWTLPKHGTASAPVPPPDTVTFTVVDVGLGVDGNRDGTIDFADNHDRQLMFWLNDDGEVVDDPWEGSPHERENPLYGPGSTKDSGDRRITTLRDLEDFASLHFLADDNLALMIPAPDGGAPPAGLRPTYRYTLSLGAADTNIRLFHNRPRADVPAHVRDVAAAETVVKGAATNTAAEPEIGRMPTVLRSLEPTDADDRFRYLFEAFGHGGRAALNFTVTVTYPQSGGTGGQPRTTSRTHTVDLDLRDIKDLYTRMRVPYRNGDRDDRFTHFAAGTEDLPHFGAAQALFTGDTRGIPFLSGSDTVVLVHGWNMTDGTQTRGAATDWKRASAETAFKRLYWQGFRGNVTAFDWPTFADQEGRLQGDLDWLNFTYNASEYQALRSGQSLMTFLADKKAMGPVHLLAHSMGNVVAAEALRQWTAAGNAQSLVSNYVAMQGALSAAAYGDDATDATGDDPSGHDFYRYWPDRWLGTERRYYMQGTDQAAGRWINMFNEVDRATSAELGWVGNNRMKPRGGDIWTVQSATASPTPQFIGYRVDRPEYGGRLLRSYVVNGLPSDEIDLKPWLVAPGAGQLPGPAAYEVLAFMSKANAKPIGTKEVDHFGMNIDISDLGLDDPYVREMSGHSFQFHFDAATTSQFWKRVVDETHMDTVSKPRSP
jgi:autotransporter-associated beta strand protein